MEQACCLTCLGNCGRQLRGLQAEVYDASPSRISNSRSFNPHSTCHSTTSCFELRPAQLCSGAYLLPVLKACRSATSARSQDILGLVSGNGCSLAPTLWQSEQLIHACMITLLGDTNDCEALKRLTRPWSTSGYRFNKMRTISSDKRVPYTKMVCALAICTGMYVPSSTKT